MYTHANKLRIAVIPMLAALLLAGCSGPRKASPAVSQAFESVIPKPASAVPAGGIFELTSDAQIITDEANKAAAEYLAERLRPATGFALPVVVGDGSESVHAIVYTTSSDASLGNEGYELSVADKGVRISAAAPAGAFYGGQTLRQLLPAAIESGSVQTQPWEMATGTIRDLPQLAWRGSMLDVARHFFTIDEVKRYVDYLAYYKMNVLHLHLSDDQGWRIEIKSWPKLTEVGGKSEVGGGEGGFYTQEAYADLVAYAQRQHVMIIPEIDLPGHINAALASYPELYCIGKKPEIYTGTEVGFSTLCRKKDLTFKFVDDVVNELAALTPGPYIHLGGDEAAATPKDDYIAFVSKFHEIAKKHGKIMIGWEEIAQAAIDSNDVAQHWHSAEYASMAAAKGAQVIMSPSTRVYVDMQYDSTSKFGLHWAAYIEVDESYNWDPFTQVPGLDRSKILGVETPLWSETITNLDEAEYLLFPRLAGVAEIGWTPSDLRSWDNYKIRLAAHGPRMTAMGIDYYRSSRVPW
ncbi:MAG: beta-N-acetylhexosaminidase [Cyclobacteriaceae bacterium]|nr:beta-N-acetylhexosaminidase [Cyclobacteriaceae bacterium]